MKRLEWFYLQFYFSACGCNKDGRTSETCDDKSGKCNCKDNIVGNKCDEAAKSFYGFPNVQSK